MLNQETKRRIDSARDILVGKVPDPKAQVEQITTALIYKFMDDMDKESEELGGQASFFVDGYKQYAWSKLLDSRLGGFDRLNLYVEALAKMPQNPHLPQLFRDIFKDAFLPYRDPETLNLFLKEINSFTYDHSENLGNSFEYLLSVMDSQGDAGQFRTPRHIIDFIVKVVDPAKEDTILDPACGTAGFLISAYKHILRQNTAKRLGDQLSPDEKTRLMRHFVGYDISPEMVRLSLVNLYLHGFPNPNIREYDTLTSEERWDEHYDVIMANPPFMSPKGGIRPHKRFSIQANRSEVLFVDYIAEHLTIHGRAGVIVPEGIIFQSGTAYKSLRKMLVEKYVWAVVSLPSGIFQPYSGVKTSILLMDKNLAKKAESILFVKVENDGFDLGAQRRAIDKNDLTQALAILQQYKQALQNGEDPGLFLSSIEVSKMAVIAEKSKIAKNGDYNLSGERYKENLVRLHREWPIVELGEVCKPEYGFTAIAKDEGDTRFIRITDIDESGLLKTDEPKFISLSNESRPYLLQRGDLLVARTGATYGKTLFFNENFQAVFASYLIRLQFVPGKILNKYYWFLTRSENYQKQKASLVQGGGQPQFNGNVIVKIKIPLPPVEVQQEIIAELDIYQKVIEGAEQVVKNYKPSVKIDPSWEVVELGQIFTMKSGATPSTTNKSYYENGDINWVKTKDLNNSFIFKTEEKITQHALQDTHCEILPIKYSVACDVWWI
ncbi:MAG TPA: N-6 DNA methylase [Methylomirabilota bacterium]|nr:N-6 DNA methylase [Methylomirabilota bacterium]